MTRHFVQICALIMVLVLCTFYPFLPGPHDNLAVPLSAAAQVFGIIGLLLVPVGVFWLLYELRKRARRKKNLPTNERGYYFALASMVAASIVALAVSLAVFTTSLSLGLLTFAFGLYIGSRLIPKLKLLKKGEAKALNALPLYMILLPGVLFIFQIAFATTAKEFSRKYAIAQSAELITELESFRARHGRYPSFLHAVHQDYHPSVVGIEQFHYAPYGDAYNLFFEQPTVLSDFGNREFVAYNNRDEHLMMGHTAWILTGAPDQIEARQGWHSVHGASSPHWKYFWFD